MTTAELAITLAGAALLGLSVLGARHPVIHPAEVKVFRAINGLPDFLYKPLWLPMQLGNLVVGTLVGLGVAYGYRSWKLAGVVILAAVLKLVVERLVRKEVTKYLAVRQRPGTSQPKAILRGHDVPDKGPSFPSGHVILVAAVGTVVAGYLHGSMIGIPFLLAVLVAIGRVFVGAHNPLDVTAGLGAGLLVGGALAMTLI